MQKKLFKQTLGDVEGMYKEIGGYHMAYYEFKDMHRESWSERFNNFCFDMTKFKTESNCRIFNGSKHTYFDCLPETEAF